MTLTRVQGALGALLLPGATAAAVWARTPQPTSAIVTVDGQRYRAAVADDDRERAKGW